MGEPVYYFLTGTSGAKTYVSPTKVKLRLFDISFISIYLLWAMLICANHRANYTFLV